MDPGFTPPSVGGPRASPEQAVGGNFELLRWLLTAARLSLRPSLEFLDAVPYCAPKAAPGHPYVT